MKNMKSKTSSNSVNDNDLDRNIEIFTPEDRSAYFVSGVTMVSDLAVFKEYRKAIALIEQMEKQHVENVLRDALPYHRHLATSWQIGIARLPMPPQSPLEREDNLHTDTDDFLASSRGM